MPLPEEAGKVASNVVDSFKNNPACLAAVLLAAMFGILTFYAYQRDADRRTHTQDILLERCYPGEHS